MYNGKIMKGLGKGKKAQITVFMIIGIILLFSSALIFYIRGQIVEQTAEFQPIVEEVPLEAQPIKLYVEGCLNDVVTEGIRRIGIHGGYIDVTDQELSGETFDVGFVPTESDMVYMGSEETGAAIPYWYYLQSDNECSGTCVIGTKQPPLYKDTGGYRSIEAQLDRYVTRELDACLANFRQFTDQGFTVTIEGELQPDVRVTEKDVAVFLKYPVAATRGDSEITVGEYFTRIPVALKDVYDFAADITASEAEFNFLEEHTLDLIVMSSHPISEEKIPPMTEMTMNLGELYIWTLFETKQKMESYVLPQIGLMQVGGSANQYRRTMLEGETGEVDYISTALVDLMTVYLNSTDHYPKLEVNFAYLDWWPSYLNINDAQILKPKSLLSEYIPVISPNIYTFSYDVSFPVMVKIRDPAAFRDKGYDFYFALEPNIRNNAPMIQNFTSFNPGGAGGSMACEPEQRTAGPIRIDVISKYTRTPLKDVRVDFTLGIEFCYMGLTKLQNNTAFIEGNFPVGSGELRLMKEGYAISTERFGAFEDDPQNYTFEMMPEVFINASVRVKSLAYVSDGKYQMIDPASPVSEGSLDNDQSVILRFKRIDNDTYYGYKAFYFFDRKTLGGEVQLIPGTYEIEGELINEKGHRIGDQYFSYTIPFVGEKKEKINATEFDTWMEGGIRGIVEIPEQELLTSKAVVFYVLKYPKPTVQTKEIQDGPDLSQLGTYAEYTELYKDVLQPKFIK